MKRTVLIADDEPLTLMTLDAQLREAGYRVVCGDGDAALRTLQSQSVDALITDVRMPGLDGWTLLERARSLHPALPVIVMTGYGAIEDAVRAVRAGAMDYLTKPVSGEEILLRLDRVFQVVEISDENQLLRDEVDRLGGHSVPIMASPAMQSVFANIRRAAETHATVLLVGETGVGKEVCARFVHNHSAQRKGPFVAVSCAALSPGVVESELFGHEKGAFTGATTRREGHISAARHGTLYLDDIDDIALPVQAKLLRFIENGVYQRVGGTETLRADVRLVASTKRSLDKLVSEGAFRDDLMYRLSVVQIEIPPLRERREDIGALAEHFLRRSVVRMGRTSKTFTAQAIQALSSYSWPGNVRELEHVVESLVAMHEGDEIDAPDLAARLTRSAAHPRFTLHLDGCENVPLDALTADFEHALLTWALSRAHGSQAQAAKILQIPRSTFQYRLGKSLEQTNTRPETV